MASAADIASTRRAAPSQIDGLPVSYSFFNGTPRQLTQFASPIYTVDQLNPDLGLYVQDQWRLNRVTDQRRPPLRLGARVGGRHAKSPAGLLVPARSYPARTDVPNWKDLNPRFGVVWDPTGSAKTAIKFGINRYVQSATTGIAQLFDQAAGAVNSTTRSWTDANGNFLPDCDLTADRRLNGECGADGQRQLRHLRPRQLARPGLDHRLGQARPTTGRPR